MDIIVLLLLVIGIAFVAVSWAKSDLRCPPPKIVYMYIHKHRASGGTIRGTDNN